MTQAGQGEEPQEPDATMQLKVPASFKADETMQLRVSDIPALPDTSEEGADGKARSSKNRRKAPRLSLFVRVCAVLGPRLAPLVAALTPYVARVTPYARKLRPLYPRPGRTDWRRWIPSWRQWLGGVLASIGLSSLLLVVAYAATDIPDNLNPYATQQDNVYFWADGTPMARTGWVQRQAMPLKDIPEDVRWAVLAAENASFYSDPGISFKGISRALFRTIGQGDTQGGSTITQQYVKNVYLNQNQTVSRKFTEAMIALKLDNQMSKDDILEGYLNTSWFGRGTYGIQRAAQAYYGKDVSAAQRQRGRLPRLAAQGRGPVRPHPRPGQPRPGRRALVLDPGPDGRHRQAVEGRARQVHQVPRAAQVQPALRHR